ncbi:hypothetical protein LJC11_04005 [Bacteroidales bacterium OttesenSCG-928-I21]|nr:hypothetical protein [Bacteroidales bacterium OttesenSCG-928-I21]
MDVPPVYTKTWFHTGFYKNSDNISDLYSQEYYQENPEWRLPDTIVPNELTPQEKREAARVLKGSILRQEVYSQDGSDKADIPYTVTENSYLIKVRQRKFENKHAVFMVLPEESIVLNYERHFYKDPNDENIKIFDPRIVHTLNLEYDEYGNPLTQATVAYKRLTGNTAGQNKTLVSLQENAYYELKSTDSFHRIGVPIKTINNEITEFNNRSTKLSISDILAATKTKIQHQQTLYYVDVNGNLTIGSFGDIDKRALQYRTETLAFTDTNISDFCAYNTLTNAPTVNEVKTILRNNGYGERNSEFWQPSEAVAYDKDKFYLPYRQIDPMGNITKLTYDAYSLLPILVEDALNFPTNIVNDYINMQPVKITDPNGNVVEMQLNGLGMVIKQAVNNGNINNFEGDTINSPTIEYEYYLGNWADTEKPAYIVSKAKTIHGSNDNRLEAYEYTDGLGRAILTKTTAEDGYAYDSNGNLIEEHITRFVASGRIIYNNKGDIVMQYEPWYSNNPGYESNSVVMEKGVTPIMYYDPLGRLIKTDFPDGTTTRVEFNAWEQLNYDQNDCDINSPNYNTPQIVYINSLGTPYKTIDDNRENPEDDEDDENLIETTQTIDILGQITEVEDALGRRMTQNLYNMAGQLIATTNIDSGLRQMLYNAAQLPIYIYDNRKQRIRNTYDALLRPLQVFLKENAGTEITVQKIEYGNSAAKRNINQIENIYAQDGKTSFSEYDFKGNILTLTKQFAQVYNTVLDYTNVSSVALQTEGYKIETVYNALNVPINIMQPDNTIVENIYDKGGLLKAVKHNNQGYITDILYNARGQREHINYGNNSTTSYYYDTNNFRLTRLLTTKQSGVQDLQDLNYTYDAVGNIIEVTDNAQQVNYFNNTTANPTGTYEYDALYRLLKATGREKKNLSAPGWEDFQNNLPVPNLDPNALQNYTHNYSYDKLGNILQQQVVGNWTRNYVYDTLTNRLLNNGTGQAYTYDEHGNVKTMPHLSVMNWDYQDMLKEAQQGTTTSYYNYDIEGNRTRKVVEKQGGIKEERYYVGNYEIYKITGSLDNHERSTVKLNDDTKTFVLVETRTGENAVIRFQYDNHLGSACLELYANL